MEFIKACSVKELSEGVQKIVECGAQKEALFHFNKEITAIGNACLHKASSIWMHQN